MKDKNGIEIKCENCEYRNPCLECATCENGGFKPKGKALEARIAELEAENAELKDHISKSEKMVDVRQLVKPLQWEIENVYNNFCIEDTDFFAKCGDFLFTITHVRNECSISCETKEIKYFQDSIIVKVKYESCVKLITQIYIENSVQSNIIDLNKAKQAAQDWLVSLVANVCGLESEVRNG